MDRQSRRARREREQNENPPTNAPAPAPPAGKSRPWLAMGLVAALILGAVGFFVVLPLLRGGGTNSVVVIETSMGTIKAELLGKDAPITVANFLKYVDAKHYDDTIFHRVIPDFMIQGGGFDKDLNPRRMGERDGIKNESYNGLLNKRGTLAMARTNQPNSATDQFFISVKDNEFLDRANARDRVGYAVFGKVLEGMDVVDKIAAVETAKRAGQDDVPVTPVFIKSIRPASDEK